MAFNILDHVVLAYEPVWGRSLALTGVRLRVHVLDPASVEVARLWRLLAQERSDRAPFLLLSLTDAASVQQLLAEAPAEGLWLELPGDAGTQEDAFQAAVRQALAAGHRLVEPVQSGATATLPVHAGILQLIELAGTTGVLPAGQLLRHADGVERLLSCPDAAEAAGLVGWPAPWMPDGPLGTGGSGMSVDRGSVERVLQAMDQDASLEVIEGLILQDVVLAWRAWCLLRPGTFGPERQIDSLRQALMLMGQSRLRGWLLEQQAQAVDEHRLWPLRQSLVLRAHLMEQIVEPGAELALVSDIRLTGLFSRLDQVLHQPMDVALNELPLADAVRQALLDGVGPYHPYLEMACALEQLDAIDRLPDLLATQGMRLDEVNRALIRLLCDQRVQT